MKSATSASGTSSSSGDTTPNPSANSSHAAHSIATWIAALSSLLALMPAFRWLAARIAWPFGSVDPEIVGALSRSENTKPLEFGLFALLLIASVSVVPWLMRRWRRAFDPAESSAVAAFLLVFLAGFLGWSGLRTPPTTSTACWPLAVLAAAIAAGPTRRRIARFGTWRDPLTRGFRTTLALLAITLPVLIFVLSVGPRTAGDLELSRAMLRVVACGAGSFLALGGLVAIVSALASRSNAMELALAASRHWAWLALASFAPRNPWIVGGAITIAVTGIVWEGRRYLRDPRLPRDGLAHICRVVFPMVVLTLANVDDPHGAIDFFHLGETATLAQEFLDGRLPYVDFYVQHGLARNVGIPAAAMGVLDSSIAAERVGESVVRALTHLAAYSLCQVLLGSRVLALVFALACASPGLWFPDRFLPLFLFLATLLRGLGLARDRGNEDEPAPRWIELAGILAVVCLAWSLDSGLYALITIPLAIGLETVVRHDRNDRWRELRTLGLPAIRGLLLGATGFSIVLLLTAGSHGLLAAAENFARQTTHQLSTWGLPFPRSLDSASLAPTSAALHAILSAGVFLLSLTVWCASGSQVRRSLVVRQCVVVSILGLCVFRTALGRSDDAHLRYPLPFALLIAAAFVQHVIRSNRESGKPVSLNDSWRFVPVAILLAFLVTAFTPLYGIVRQWIDLSTVRAFEATSDHAQLELPRLGGVMIPRPQAQFLATLHAELEERLAPDQTFFDFSNMGALYFLFERPCPTRFVAPVYAATDEMQRELISDLERTKPPLAFSCRTFGYETVDGIPMNERASRVGTYLKAHYAKIEDLGFGWLLIRTTP